MIRRRDFCVLLLVYFLATAGVGVLVGAGLADGGTAPAPRPVPAVTGVWSL